MAGPAGRKVRTVYLCVLYLASLGYDRVWEAIDLGRKLRSALFPNPDDCYSWQLQFFYLVFLAESKKAHKEVILWELCRKVPKPLIVNKLTCHALMIDGYK